jgi:hypothetical protein
LNYRNALNVIGLQRHKHIEEEEKIHVLHERNDEAGGSDELLKLGVEGVEVGVEALHGAPVAGAVSPARRLKH